MNLEGASDFVDSAAQRLESVAESVGEALSPQRVIQQERTNALLLMLLLVGVYFVARERK